MEDRHAATVAKIREVFADAGMARFYNQMADGPFAIITAYRPEPDYSTREQNVRSQEELKETVYHMGLGFVEGAGVWEGGPKEPSLFIPGISKSDAASLGHIFSQESVIWGDEGIYYFVDCKTGEAREEGAVEDHFKYLGKEYEAEPWEGKNRGWTALNKNEFTLTPEKALTKAREVGGEQREVEARLVFSCTPQPHGVHHPIGNGVRFVSAGGPIVVRKDVAYIPIKGSEEMMAKLAKHDAGLKAKWAERRAKRPAKKPSQHPAHRPVIATGGEEIVDKFWIDASGGLVHHGKYVTHQEYALDFLREEGGFKESGDRNRDMLKAEAVLLERGWIRGQVYSMSGVGLQGKEEAVKSYGAIALQLVPKPKRGYYMSWPGEGSIMMSGADFKAFLGKA